MTDAELEFDAEELAMLRYLDPDRRYTAS